MGREYFTLQQQGSNTDLYEITDTTLKYFGLTGNELFALDTNTSTLAIASLLFRAGTGSTFAVADGGDDIGVEGDLEVLGSFALGENASDPAATTNTGRFYTKDVAGGTEAFYIDAAGNVIQLTSGGSINPAAVDHGGLGGLSDDDHTQYPLLLGRSGGQTLIGGTGFGDDLTLSSSSHATKGNIFFGSSTGLNYDETNKRLGIGIAAPLYPLHIPTDGRAARFGGAGAAVQIDLANSTSNIWRLTNGWSVLNEFQIVHSADDSVYSVKATIDENNNLRIGILTSSGTGSPISTIVIPNGVHPTAPPTDSVSLFAEDVAASSELRVMDEATNETTLSPHNFTLFTPDPSYGYPWSYYAKNRVLGKEINVDMYGALKALEQVTGQKFIYERDLPPEERLDWEKIQDEKEAQRDEQIAEHGRLLADYQASKAEWDIATPEERDKVSEPQHPGPRSEKLKRKVIPTWMQERMA